MSKTLRSGLCAFVAILTLSACGALPQFDGPDEPAPVPGAPDGASSPQAPVKPFVAPEPPLPVPAADGLTITLSKFAQLPASKTNPPVPRGDKLDRHNRINYLGELPDGSGRLYVPDLNGPLYLLSDGEPHVYLDFRKKFPDLWTKQGFGSGFGSVAFDPEFGENGRFYTVHTESGEALDKTPDFPSAGGSAVVHGIITEWTAEDPTADAFAGGQRQVMRFAFPAFIHGLQLISFNPHAKQGDDDYGLLYIAVGDGGAVGKATEADQESTVPQDLGIPQGKILRINPRADGDEQWTVPPGNPFAGQKGKLGEIYAYGLRDPYRFSWDTEGDHRMLLGAMGENRAESIYDVHAGDNFGWPKVEGPFTALLRQNCDVAKLPDPAPDFTYPVAAYSHIPKSGAGSCDDTGYAVIGGFVYRGEIAALRGQYIFGDGVGGEIFHVDVAQMQRGGALAPIGLVTLREDGKDVTLKAIASDPGVLTAGKPRVDLRFGMDRAGELYVLAKSNGTIWRVTDAEG